MYGNKNKQKIFEQEFHVFIEIKMVLNNIRVVAILKTEIE